MKKDGETRRRTTKNREKQRETMKDSTWNKSKIKDVSYKNR